jgi:nitrogen fixation protein NifZ
MAEAQIAKYQWGQTISSQVDLINDGSFPDVEAEAVLVEKGMRGEVVNVGTVEETGAPVYLVEFTNGKVVGVLEDEISLA